jgi:UDP-2,4-diacetamido-2,4,6-trideoxy-beta-L-altropyranose hydrolase
MHIAFRCDADSTLGSGHLRRCAVLAQEALDNGAEVSFLMRTDANPLWNSYVPAGASVAASTEDNICHELIRWSDKVSPNILVVDHYDLVHNHAEHIARSGARWMMFDNGQATTPIHANIVHNALPGITESDYAHRTDRAQFLLGPAYALLRPEFRKTNTPAGEGKILAILFGGGSDRGMILRTLRAIDGDLSNWERHVFITSANTALDEIRAWSSGKPNIVLHIDEPRVAEKLRAATLAITAVGTTINELACLGVPALGVAIAGNQIPGGKLWDSAGALNFLGEAEHLSDDSLRAGIVALATNGASRANLAATASRLVDGLGASRTFAALSA